MAKLGAMVMGSPEKPTWAQGTKLGAKLAATVARPLGKHAWAQGQSWGQRGALGILGELWEYLVTGRLGKPTWTQEAIGIPGELQEDLVTGRLGKWRPT